MSTAKKEETAYARLHRASEDRSLPPTIFAALKNWLATHEYLEEMMASVTDKKLYADLRARWAIHDDVAADVLERASETIARATCEKCSHVDQLEILNVVAGIRFAAGVKQGFTEAGTFFLKAGTFNRSTKAESEAAS